MDYDISRMTLREILAAKEGENIEFKRAENRFSYEELVKYMVALANAGGGGVVFGVTDKRPRQALGTLAFEQPEETRKKLREQLRLNIDFRLFNEGKPDRVLVFITPSRPLGAHVSVEGVAWWKDGESLVPMPSEIQRQIFEEGGRDFSQDVCAGATLSDLSVEAIEAFREAWIKKSGNHRLAALSREQLLADCGATVDGGVTNAALILFGTNAALTRFLPQSEICFEYKLRHSSGPADDAVSFREAFFGCHDKLWNLVNLRNEKAHFQEGLFVWDVPAFNEKSVREALLNAVCHRSYQSSGSVFVRQFPDMIQVESPGGFAAGITPENILRRQYCRNRRIAEILQRTGLIERSGQGMNIIYEQSILEAKDLPSFEGTDAYQVVLTLRTAVLDETALRFFSVVGDETLSSFDTSDFLAVRRVLDGRALPRDLLPNANRLVELGILEHSGRSKYLLARRFYESIGQSGVHTRKEGLDRSTNKELLLKHVRSCGTAGAKLGDFLQVLPAESPQQIQRYLVELREEGRVVMTGRTKAARWFAAETKIVAVDEEESNHD